MDDSTRHEPPLSRRDHDESVIFCGTREQLLAAGVIVADDPLPGDPGMRNTFARFNPGHPRRIAMIWRRGTRFTVEVLRPQHEREAIARGEELRRAREQFEREARLLEQRIEDLPRTHAAFRQTRERALRTLMASARALTEPAGGFSFDQETVAEIALLVRRIRKVLAEGATQFDQELRDAEVERMRSDLRAKDPDFARFLRELG